MMTYDMQANPMKWEYGQTYPVDVTVHLTDETIVKFDLLMTLPCDVYVLEEVTKIVHMENVVSIVWTSRVNGTIVRTRPEDTKGGD